MAGCRTADDDRLDAYHCPLRIRQIASEALFLSLIFRSSDFGPHLCLDDCFATTILTQLTEITQFIFGQPLSRPKERCRLWLGTRLGGRLWQISGTPCTLGAGERDAGKGTRA